MIAYCFRCVFVFFFKQKTAYEMRISDWSSDVCSSDLGWSVPREARQAALQGLEPDLRAALELAAERIRAYHAGQKPEDRDETDAAGVRKIGRASCRERGCQYVAIAVVGVSLKKKTKNTETDEREIWLITK